MSNGSASSGSGFCPAGTNRNSASRSMYFVISQAQAMRSTPTCSQVTHFMMQILLSLATSEASPRRGVVHFKSLLSLATSEASPRRGVVHFKSLLLHSSVAPAPVNPPPNESSLAPAPAGTCGRARRGQRRPAPTRPGSPGRQHPHGPETGARAHLPAHLRAGAIPTGRLLPRVRQSPQLTIETVRVSRGWQAAPTRHHARAAPPTV